MRTHNLGNMCRACEAILVDDLCSCGQRHGFGYQEVNDWARRTWPDHPCFQSS